MRILIIEDTVTAAELMAYYLRAAKFTTTIVGRAETGLMLVKKNPPDLIICDLNLPGMDGLEFARSVKADKRLAKIPLVAVTAHGLPSDKERCLAAGFNGYIAKPINPRDFAKKIAKYLNG